MSDDADSPEGTEPRAKDELLEAIDHLRNAATIFFDRAARDPAVERATEEADKVLTKIADSAEPVARQVTSEVARLTKRLSEVLTDSIDSVRKPPRSDD